ncbi:hypothetical protein [Paraflavitalea speifideaquila]|nr:hypothetical protein [Paraflavitalea speifideiaquila]
METIHNYVRKNMEWNSYGGIWALNGVKSAWKDKKALRVRSTSSWSTC